MKNACLLFTLSVLSGCYSAVDLDEAGVLKEKYGVFGLITDPSPAQLKAGALATAHNVCFRRPNMASPRPGFSVTSGGYGTDNDEIWKLIPFGGQILTVGSFEGSTQSSWSGAGTAEIKDDAAANLQWTKPHVRGAVARKNLYLTTSDAVRKVTAAADLVASLAHGLIPPVVQLSVPAGTTFANNARVAYRTTASRTDANNVVTVSASSARFLVTNDSGLPKDFTVLVYLDTTSAVGDVHKVYRSAVVTSPAAPSDDLRLVHERVLTSAETAAGFYTVTDTVLDAARGESLYTNPTREGIERSNASPPLARDLALYQGSLFAANVTYPPSLQIAYSDDEAADPSRHNTVGTRTNASAVIAVASAAGLKIGQVLTIGSGSSWSGTAAVRITGIAGLNITMSETWGGATDGVPVAVRFSDSLRIKSATEDKYYPVINVTNLALGINSAVFTSGFRIIPSAEFYALPLGNAADATNAGQRRTVQLIARLPSHAGFQVFATNGDKYEPVLPEPTEATGKSSVALAVQNGLSWSKTDQPEHFLLSALRYVGVETSPILRIIPTKDSLFIFKGKGDGIYRLTGFGERSGWRVDPVSEDTYLLHPELVLETDEKVYAWTNKGLVQVTDAGVSPPLTAPIATTTAEQEQKNAFTTTTFYAFCAANTKDGELIFGLPAERPGEHEGVSSAYVYNTRTQSWSTWLDGATHYTSMAYDPASGSLYLARDDSGSVAVERPFYADVVNADEEYSITITDISGSQITIAGGSGWTPVVGDMVIDGAFASIVNAVGSPTIFTVQDNTGFSGAATAYVAFSSTLTWQPDTGGSSSTWKRYQEHVTHWNDTWGLYRWSIALVNGAASETNDYTRTFQRTTHSRADTRALPSRSTSYARHLDSGVVIRSADARWEITGVGLIAESASVRAHR